MREASAEKDTRTDMTNAEENKAAAVAEQGAHVAPQKAPSKKVATRKKGAPKRGKKASGAEPKRTVKASKRAAKPERKTATPRADSKGAQILALIRRPKGATLAELAKLTGWQNHSIRGFLSGAIGKKMGLTVESIKREDGERVYSIKK
jgi:hypothetical protein